jgi:DNA repair exonuclease SbcCD ATPase subunit
MALSAEEIHKKIENLQVRHDKVLKKRSELGGELKAKKEELSNLVKEITEAGFNPKTISEDKNTAQGELETLMTDFEKTLSEVESSLSTYDNKK